MNRREAKQIACHQAAWRLISDRDGGVFGADDLSDEDNERVVSAINELISELVRRCGPYWKRGADANAAVLDAMSVRAGANNE